jgi:hypothetical protein
MRVVAIGMGFSLGHLYFSEKASSLCSEFDPVKTSIFTHWLALLILNLSPMEIVLTYENKQK